MPKCGIAVGSIKPAGTTKTPDHRGYLSASEASAMTARELLQRAKGKPPGFLVRRALRELAHHTRGSRLPLKLGSLTASQVAQASGYSAPEAMWKNLESQGFFLPSADVTELRHLYDGPYAGEAASLRRSVDRILAHEFDLLGSGPTRLGDELDWHRDFKSGRRWELDPSYRIRRGALDGRGDIKVPWELSRCQWLVDLARAWVLFADRRCPREFEKLIRSWLSANPIGRGVNWACTMDVALRAVSWVWALRLFGADSLEPAFRQAIMLALYRHGWWISKNLETSDINGNHYISDALGLIACGLPFGMDPRACRWLKSGSEILEQEIRLQVSSDGADFEGSVQYHRLVLEILLVGERMLTAAGWRVSSGYRDRLQRMFDFVDAYVTPEGLSPVIGDADDGRALVLGNGHLLDHRYLLSIASAMFRRPQWKARAGRLWEDALWLLGPQALEEFEALPVCGPEQRSRGFADAGFYVLRSHDHYLFADAGPVGFGGRGGHGHNDCLAFEWHGFGRPLLTDSGAYVYTASPAWRNRFRATSAHNSIRIDREEINRIPSPLALWTLRDDARPLAVRFVTGPKSDLLSAGHGGYRRLAGRITVFRSFEFDRTGPRFQIADRIEGCGLHLVEFFFHAAPGAMASRDGGPAVEFSWPDSVRVLIECESASPVRWRTAQGWFSPSYGVKLNRPVWVASINSQLPVAVTWRLSGARGSVRLAPKQKV